MGTDLKLPICDIPQAGPMVLKAWPEEFLQPGFQARLRELKGESPLALWCDHLEQAELGCSLDWVDALIVEYNPFFPRADEELFWQAEEAGKAIWVRNGDGMTVPPVLVRQREDRWAAILAEFPEYQNQARWLASAFARHYPAVTTLLYRAGESEWQQALGLPPLEQEATFRVKRLAVGLGLPK